MVNFEQYSRHTLKMEYRSQNITEASSSLPIEAKNGNQR